MNGSSITDRGPIGRMIIQMLWREYGKKVPDFAAMAEGTEHAKSLQKNASPPTELNS